MNCFKLNQNTAYIKIRKRNGEVYRAFFDLKDAKKVCKYSWYLSSQGYARTCINRKHISMPEVIFNQKSSYLWHFDHLDQDKLNNKRENLKYCHVSENIANRKEIENKSTGFYGVTADKTCYRVRDRITGKHKGFKDLTEAMLCSFVNYLEMTGDFERALQVFSLDADEEQRELLRCTAFLYTLQQDQRLHSKCN